MSTSAQTDTLNRTDANGLKQGKWVQYYKNGNKRYEGEFADGKPKGIFTYYDENGFVNMLLYHKKDGITVVANAYHPNGRIMAMGLYRNHKKDSIWQFYNEREVLISTETYEQGLKHGLEREFYIDGQLAAETPWHKGKKEGLAKEYYQNGQVKSLLSYINDKLEGKVQYFYANGNKKMTGQYKNNVRNGLWKEYYKNGTPKAQRLYEHGRVIKMQIDNGPYTEYYNSTCVREEGQYKHAKKNGSFIVYFDTGEPKKKYIEPDPEKAEVGGWVESKEERKIKIKGNYKDGKWDGKIVYYNQEGKVEKTEFYKEGVLMNTRNE